MDDVWTTHGHRANLTCIVESVKNRLHHGQHQGHRYGDLGSVFCHLCGSVRPFANVSVMCKAASRAIVQGSNSLTARPQLPSLAVFLLYTFLKRCTVLIES